METFEKLASGHCEPHVRRGNLFDNRWFMRLLHFVRNDKLDVFQRSHMGIDDFSIARDQQDMEHLHLLLAFTLSADSNCIDVGAHTGDVLREIIRCAPNGRHIAYEPLPHLHEQLIKDFPQVDVRLAALSNKNGEASFTHVKSNPGYSGFKRRTYPGTEELELIIVRIEPLDSSLPEGYVPSLIKIDVEGGEQQVIEGAIRTIALHKPIVIFEHGKGASEHYGTGPEDIFNLLCNEAGLRIFDLDGNGPYSLEDLSRTFEQGNRWNFVAHT
jgi:FkbM family methyltransferase